MILEQEAADYDKGFTEEGKLDTDRFERIKEGAIRFIVNEKDILKTDPDYDLIKQYATKYKEFLQQMTDIMFDDGVLSEPEFTDPNRNIILTLKRKIKNSGMLLEMKKRTYYQKPSKIKREQKNLAILRQRYQSIKENEKN